MRTVKSVRHADFEADVVHGEDGPGAAEEADDTESDIVRVVCPDCGQPVALTASAAESLPQHALCPTPWNPFGLTVCPGSGRAASAGARVLPLPAAVGGAAGERGTLPEGLDWRLQPFSHAVAGRPVRLSGIRQAA